MNSLIELDNAYIGYEWLTELHCQFLLTEVLTERKYLNTTQILYIDAFIKLACQKVFKIYPPEPNFWLPLQNTLTIQHAFLGSHVSDIIFNPLTNPNNCLVALHSDMPWNVMRVEIDTAINSPGTIYTITCRFKYKPFYSDFWYFGVFKNYKFYSIHAYYSTEFLT
jgi:hypothetical protein